MVKKIKGPQMIIANRLDTGRVVFLGADNQWHTQADKAITATDETVLEDLWAKAQADLDANIIIDAQLIAAEKNDHVAMPSHIKHIIQAQGPTVRTDLGYQVSPDWEG